MPCTLGTKTQSLTLFHCTQEKIVSRVSPRRSQTAKVSHEIQLVGSPRRCCVTNPQLSHPLIECPTTITRNMRWTSVAALVVLIGVAILGVRHRSNPNEVRQIDVSATTQSPTPLPEPLNTGALEAVNRSAPGVASAAAAALINEVRGAMGRHSPPSIGEQDLTEQERIVRDLRREAHRRSAARMESLLQVARNNRLVLQVESDVLGGASVNSTPVSHDAFDEAAVWYDMLVALCVKRFASEALSLPTAHRECTEPGHECREADLTNEDCGGLHDHVVALCPHIMVNDSENGQATRFGTLPKWVQLHQAQVNAASRDVSEVDARSAALGGHRSARSPSDGTCSIETETAPSPLGLQGLTLDGPHWRASLLALLIDVDGWMAHSLRRLGYAAGLPFGGWLCMVPKVRALVWFHHVHRWMFSSPPGPNLPIADPDFLVDTVLEKSSGGGGPRSGGRPQPFPPNPSFQVNFSFADKKAASRASARAKAIYYTMANVAVQPPSPQGAWLVASGVPHGKKKLELLRDERFINIRKLAIYERSTTSTSESLHARFRLRSGAARLYLMPLLFGSDNIGHVMFRFYSALDVLDEVWGARAGDPHSNVVFGFVVLPSAGTTFNLSSNVYRVFHDPTSRGKWFSVLPGEREQQRRRAARESASLDITFDTILVGFGRTYMFHPRHIPNLDEPRRRAQSVLNERLHQLRIAVRACFHWEQEELSEVDKNNTALSALRVKRPSADATVVRAVLILRRSRVLLNASALAVQFRASWIQGSHPESFGKKQDAPPKGALELSTVYLEELTIREQIALASHADIWVGVAGTGLSWMMFMKRGGVVVEIQDPPIMRCAGEGINEERLYCDFSKQSVAAGLHHIGVVAVRAPTPTGGVCSDFLRCNVTLSQRKFDGALLAAWCSVGKAPDEARDVCSTLLR